MTVLGVNVADGGINGTGIDETAAKTQATYVALGWDFTNV